MTDEKYPTLRCRVSPELAERVERAAKRAGQSQSAWLRSCIEARLSATPVPRSPAARPDREQLQAAIDATEGRHRLPHLVGADGSCAGGCDPDTDALCTVGPDDPRRGRKRR